MLLDSLSVSIERDFHIPISVGEISANAIQTVGVKEPITKLVLVGASNLKRVIVHLRNSGYEVIDLCHPGWLATPATVAELCQKIRALTNDSNTAFVFDVFGNSTTRFELYDGTTLLRVKTGFGFHLLGKFRTVVSRCLANCLRLFCPFFRRCLATCV